MSKVAIVRTEETLPDDAGMGQVRQFLTRCYRGLSESDNKAWNRFLNRLKKLDTGEISFLEFIIPRNPAFHRKFFALLNIGFDAWEPTRKHKTHKGKPISKNLDQFREDIIILAGFYEPTFDLKGRMVLRAKSISFAKIDDAEFEAVYYAVADVLLAQVLHTYAGREELDSVVDRVMRFQQ